MKTAIVHDWIMSMRGGEKCLEVFCELFPDATIFTLVHKKGIATKIIENMDIRTSFIQKLPKAISQYRNYLPLFPAAIESFDLTGYDLILSSSHCVAKGVRVPEGARHICYCYTPMRYVWLFFNEYFGKDNIIKKAFIAATARYLKKWDLKTNKSVDYFLAISDNIKNRISDIYNKESDVIYPPVDIDKFVISRNDKDFYLIISALVPYKRIDLAVEAFGKINKKLIIVGAGNAKAFLKKQTYNNIEFRHVGYDDFNQIKQLYSDCTALIFPGEEDFGIVPVEAQACGKPVIAYAKGGALETVIPLNPMNYELRQPETGPPQAETTNNNPTGVFFYEQTPQALIKAIEMFEENKHKFIPEKIRENSLRFDRAIFKQRIKNYIEEKLK